MSPVILSNIHLNTGFLSHLYMWGVLPYSNTCKHLTMVHLFVYKLSKQNFIAKSGVLTLLYFIIFSHLPLINLCPFNFLSNTIFTHFTHFSQLKSLLWEKQCPHSFLLSITSVSRIIQQRRMLFFFKLNIYLLIF